MNDDLDFVKAAKICLQVCLSKLSQSIQATDPGDPKAIEAIANATAKVGDLLIAQQVLNEDVSTPNPPNP